MSTWTIRVADKNFTPQGEVINIQELKTSIVLSKLRTSAFKVRLDNPMASFLANNVDKEPIYVKFYRNGKLMANQPVMTVQEAGDEAQDATLTVTCAGPEFIWASRIYSLAAAPVKLTSAAARAVKYKELLAAYLESTHLANRTYIDYTTGPIEGGATTEFEVPWGKTLAEIINEMTNSTDGFDWTVWPTETLAISGVPTIGRLEAKEVLGVVNHGTVFEWGGARNNLATFNRVVDVTNVANSIYSVSPAGPEAAGSPIQQAIDSTKAEEWGSRQALAPLSALSNVLRLKLAEEALSVRRLPRQTLSIQPIIDDGAGLVPVFGQDYTLGDTVRARILYDELVHLDAFVRVWGVEFAVDTNGKETQTLLVSEQ